MRFLVLSVSASAQTGRSYKYRFNGDLQETNVVTGDHSLTINYRLSELTIDNLINDNGIFYRIAVPGHTLTTDPGKPELPVLSRLIEIPEGSEYTIRISDVESTGISPSKNEFKGILFPSQHGETKQKDTQKRGFVIDREIILKARTS